MVTRTDRGPDEAVLARTFLLARFKSSAEELRDAAREITRSLLMASASVFGRSRSGRSFPSRLLPCG
eukprot:1396563-Rhodomonas_salina.2